MSHPLRVRGLKRLLTFHLTLLSFVAPPTGAWIETGVRLGLSRQFYVAPPTGAWIETTLLVKLRLCDQMSHPLRVRGLKPLIVFTVITAVAVAPPTGAWIETSRTTKNIT